VSETSSDFPAVPRRRDHLGRREGALNLLYLLGTHAALGTWFWLAGGVLPLALWLPASVLVCVIHQRAMSEWIHEAAHFNLVPDRRWNDSLGNALAAFAFVTTTRRYRESHFRHHAREDFFVPEDDDTGMHTIASRREFRRELRRDAVGLSALTTYRRIGQRTAGVPRSARELAETAVPHLVLLGWLLLVGRPEVYLLYYGTLATAYPVVNRLRFYGQHVKLGDGGTVRVAGSDVSRTIEASVLDRLFLTSTLLLYHHEHHRHPHLPYRALPLLCERAADPNRYLASRWVLLRRLYAGLPR